MNTILLGKLLVMATIILAIFHIRYSNQPTKGASGLLEKITANYRKFDAVVLYMLGVTIMCIALALRFANSLNDWWTVVGIVFAALLVGRLDKKVNHSGTGLLKFL